MSEIENKAKRVKIAAKIKALLNKTTGNGCTEDEALAASGLAAELMAEYDVSYTDIEGEIAVEVFGCRKREFWKRSGKKVTAHAVQYCLTAVGTFWDCRVWSSGTTLLFFGEQSDTENAHHMADMLRSSIDIETARYLASPTRDSFTHGRTLAASFRQGMAVRLAERLREIKAARSQADAAARGPAAGPSGSALVVAVKTRVVAEKFTTYSRDAGLNLRKRSGGSSARSGSAYAAGKAAGSRADLGGSRVAGGNRMIGRG